MLRTLAKCSCYALLTLLALVSLLIGWCCTTPIPEGTFFATVIPLMAARPPQTLFGDWVTPLTSAVPEGMQPLPRPAKERLIPLAGTGDLMPANGLGMCCRASAYDDESVRRSVLWYLLQGGRHIDTAMLYLNHKPIGEAIDAAVARGVPRSEVFVTTKLTERAYTRGAAAIDALLRQFASELRVDALHLVLLHFPKPIVPLGQSCSDWSACRADAWRALADARRRGLVRNIGVSNFDVRQLEELSALPEAREAPIAANQIMLSPFSPPFAFETAKWCVQHNVAVVAHSPLAGMEKAKALSHETIAAIAARHTALRTPAQVILKWAIQKGFCVIPGSGNPAHQSSNLQIFDAELSAEEMGQIDTLQGHEGFFYMDMREGNATASSVEKKDEM